LPQNFPTEKENGAILLLLANNCKHKFYKFGVNGQKGLVKTVYACIAPEAEKGIQCNHEDVPRQLLEEQVGKTIGHVYMVHP